MDQTLTTRHLDYTYKKTATLKNINLSFSQGSLHGILGPNGSGKSTLLKVLSYIWHPSNGDIYWNNKNFQEFQRKEISRLISLVPQNPQPTFDFLVEDIVAMGRYPHGGTYWSKNEKEIIDECLELVDAKHLSSRLVTQLSQGEKQRVYIARALVTQSPILLLYEPTANLDIKHQLEIWNLLREQVLKGKIVIIATHDLTLAKHYCDTVAVLNNGVCLGQDTFSSLMKKELIEDVFGVTEAIQNDSIHYVLSK